MANAHAEMIHFQHGPLRISTTEIWSARNVVVSGDIVRYWYCDAPPPGNAHFVTQYTIEIDLTARMESLRAAMRRSTRIQIRRAEADGLQIHFWLHPDAQVLESFVCFYDRVAWKRLPGSSVARLHALEQNGMLALSSVDSSSDEPLVWHCYEIIGSRVRCWYSASILHLFKTSTERNKLGRANRYLHYRDMAAFQSAGFEVYDFGGWYSGKEDAKKLGINRFKEDFGGRIVKRCFCDVGVTLLGKCWLMLRRLRGRVI